MEGLPAYQCLADTGDGISSEALLPFLATLLELVKSNLTWDSTISLENWLARLPEEFYNQDAHIQIEGILATRKQQLLEETLGCFAELPMADEWTEEILSFFIELPMAGEWMDK